MPHNKIIKEVCRDILLPLGVFQKGSSRTYIDDNGYFFTVIEFQPSAYAKGTYLNVAVHFLWNEQEYLSYDFAVGLNPRIKNFVEYQDDEQFTRDVTKYVQEAAAQVLFYRNLCDDTTAKRYVNKWSKQYKADKCVSELNTINHLTDEKVLKKIKKTRAFWHSRPSMKKMKTHAIFDAL